MKKALLSFILLLFFISVFGQGNYFGTRAYRLATLTDFANLSIGTTSAWFKMATNPNGGSAIHESGFVAKSGTIPTVTNFDSKSITKSRWIGDPLFGSSNSFLFNLLPGTQYFVRGYAINEAGIIYTDLISITTQNNVGFPSVVMDYVQNVTETSADWQGYAINTGGGTISDKGFCWNTVGSPTKLDSYVSIGSGNGSFNYTKTGLTANTTYFVSAYATNEAGTAYSQHIEFKTTQTIVAPTVTTASITNITNNSATGGGEVTASGGASVTARGVCWSTSTNPTISDSKTVDGTGIGSFISNLTGLIGNTTYYVRAYATNSAGTGYGSQVSFTTSTALTITINSITEIQQTSFFITSSVANNTCGVTQVGTVVSSSTMTPDINTYDVKRIFGSSYSGNGAWSYTINGLSPTTTYYVRSYIITATCGVYYSATSTVTTLSNLVTVVTNNISNITTSSAVSGGTITGSGVISRGVCWSTNANPTIADSKTVDGSGSGSFTSNLSGLSSATTYYVRAYSTTSTETFYGNQVSFTTLSVPTLPTVTTTIVNNILDTDAISGGNVTNGGNAVVTSRGLVWGTSPNPTIVSYTGKTNNGSGNGVFISNLTYLSYNTTYYYRAYATNSVGTSYGQEYSFLSAPNFQSNSIHHLYNYYDTYADYSGSHYIGTSNVIGLGLYVGIAWDKITISGLDVSFSNVYNIFSIKYDGVDITSYPFDININGSSDPSLIGTSITWIDPTKSSFVSPYRQSIWLYGTLTDINGAKRSINLGFDLNLVKQTSSSAINITNNSATIPVNFLYSDSLYPSEYGVVFSTSQNPTVSNNKIVVGSGDVTSYNGILQSLSPNTTYYVRAYTSFNNGASYIYGNQISFTTLP